MLDENIIKKINTMIINELSFSDHSRNSLKKGVDTLTDAVKVTLGAKGRNVVIQKQNGAPQITKDGVTVAKDINLEDPFENMGVQMVKEVASRTNEDAGDGTTTATILAQAIIDVGLKNVAAGANPVDLKRGINLAVDAVVKHIKEQTRDIGASNEQIEQIARISANNDYAIGRLVAEAMDIAGKDGVIKVEEARGIDDEIKNVEGMQIDRGYSSPYFITDQKKMEVVLENPLILLTTKKISTVQEIIPLLEHVSKSGKSLFIIAEDIEGEALNSLIMNKVRGSLKVSAIKTPSFGDEQLDILEDLAALTGAVVISDEPGMTIAEAGISSLGGCNKIITNKDTTTIIGGDGDSEDIQGRIDTIKSQIFTAKDPYAQNLRNRMAKLVGGVAVVYIGAASELEMKEKRDRVDDAISATRAAIEEGIVPGGGVAYIRAIGDIEGIGDLLVANSDQTTGVNIIKKAIEMPLRQIIDNAGLDGSVILQKIKEHKGDYGYNVRTNKYEKFFKTGIIDPAKVVRVALQNAASVAGMFLMMECAISIKKTNT